MTPIAILVAYILANAQPITAEAERERLRLRGEPTSSVVVASMPKPSSVWAAAWATEMVSAPLFPGNPRFEIAHGIVWAYYESKLVDAGPRGDGGKSGCSFGVNASFTPWTLDELEADPAKCVSAARKAMRWSFATRPDHPMNFYAGCGSSPCPVAEQRVALVRRLAATLPPMTF